MIDFRNPCFSNQNKTMSDSEDENKEMKSFAEVNDEIKQRKRNPETSGMFVSGWDDADQDVEEVKDPKGF